MSASSYVDKPSPGTEHGRGGAEIQTLPKGPNILVGLLGISMLAAIGGIFLWVPTEATQGVVQRIFYFHLPSAWIAYLAFAIVLIGSVMYLWRGDPRWDVLARSSAEVGVVFCGLVLITGPIWGKAVWGAWWVWEPRLTLTLVMFCIYSGYLLVRHLAGDPLKGARIASVVGIAGFFQVPLVHFSVLWWRGQHPGATVVRPDGPALPRDMGLLLLFCLGVFTLLYVTVLSLRMRLAAAQEAVAMLEPQDS